MDAYPSPWAGRRVLVTGCTGFLGSAVTRELLDRGAVVAGLVRGRPDRDEFARERSEGRFWTVHGQVEDAIRLHTAFAVHEVSAVFHLAAADPFGPDRGATAIQRAAERYHPRLPVVLARPSGQLRIAREEDSAPVLLGVARFGELFGPGDRKVFRVVPRTALDLVAGTRSGFADGPRRDFVFVRDAARACLSVAEAAAIGGKPLDLTFRSGWEFGEREMATRVGEVFAEKGGIAPSPGTPRFGCGPDLPPAGRGGGSRSLPKASRMGQPPPLPAGERSPNDTVVSEAGEGAIPAPENPLGWRPEVPFAAAVQETIAWYREFAETRPVATTRKAA